MKSYKKISTAARNSRLSRAQVAEVQTLFTQFHPEYCFIPVWLDTKGDLDLKTSLLQMEKTNFFTKEIDDYLLEGKARIAIHAAKDLPDPLPEGLKVIALTRNLCPQDSLVLPSGMQLENLKSGALIGTSSQRRLKAIHALRSDLQCIEVRGPVDKRLKILEEKLIDGLVVAEAALIRLGLNRLNRIPLLSEIAPLQGRLAIVSKENDLEIAKLFAPLDRKILYLGTNPPSSYMTHYPIIRIQPHSQHSLTNIETYSHIIFTSKHAVDIFFQTNTPSDCIHKKLYAIGDTTATALTKYSLHPHYIAEEASQEGIIALLEKQNLENALILLPRSSLARNALDNYLSQRKVNYHPYPIYDTIPSLPDTPVDWTIVDEIYFTSPSTIHACKHFFPQIFDRTDITFTAIGPITAQALQKFRKNPSCLSST